MAATPRDPRRDAPACRAAGASTREELAAHLLGVPRTRLGLDPLVDDDWVDGYSALIANARNGSRCSICSDRCSFGGATVRVGPGVFIPRPETESLRGLGAGRHRGRAAHRWSSTCAPGSGAIALAISSARPDARVIGVERSAAALAWARRNIAAHVARRRNSGRAARRGHPGPASLLADLDGAVDLVTANPPYVPDGTAGRAGGRPARPRRGGVRRAGRAGGDPTADLASRPGCCRSGGVLAIEHDDTQGESVPALLGGRRLFADVLDHRTWPAARGSSRRGACP